MAVRTPFQGWMNLWDFHTQGAALVCGGMHLWCGRIGLVRKNRFGSEGSVWYARKVLVSGLDDAEGYMPCGRKFDDADSYGSSSR